MTIPLDVHGLLLISGHHALSHILQRLAHTPEDGAVAPAHEFLLFWQPGCVASALLLCLQAEAHALLQQVWHLMLSGVSESTLVWVLHGACKGESGMMGPGDADSARRAAMQDWISCSTCSSW